MASEVIDGAGERNRAERARLLRRAQHPGVAAVVADDEPAEAGITIRRHEGPRLGETALTIEEIAGVFAVLATTVADLNDLGVQIGVMTGDGVRLGRDGRPVIADLGAATIVEPPPRRGKTPNPDIRAVGALLMQTLRRCTPAVLTEVPATGHWPRRRAPTLGQHVAALARTAERGAITLRQLADGLVHPDARLPRPWATPEAVVPGEAIVTSGEGEPDPAGLVDPVDEVPIRDAVPAADRVDAAGAIPDLRQAGAGPWVRRGAIGALAVAGGMLITLGVAAIPGPPRPYPRLSPAVPGTPAATSICLAVDSSGSCASTGTYAGGVLSTPSGHFAVGKPDDVVAAGRWSCGPVATLAILRPDRGEVSAFPGWPAGGSVLTARLVARVPEARQLTARAEGACDALVVTRADGTTVVVDRRMFS